MFRSVRWLIPGALLIAMSLNAQDNAELTAHVTDVATNWPQIARIQLDRIDGVGQYQESADSNGHFHLKLLRAGTYEVTFVLSGFFYKTIPAVRLASDQHLDLGDIGLKPIVCDGFGGPVCNDPKPQPQNPAGFQTTAAGKIPVFTVCQLLSNASDYEGKLVIVTGRFTSTMEGAWLDQTCDLKLVINNRPYPTIISTVYTRDDFAPAPDMPKAFSWDRTLLSVALGQVKKTTRLSTSDLWGALLGRVEARLPRPIRPGTVRPPQAGDWLSITNGFGHESAAAVQLIPAKDGFLELK